MEERRAALAVPNLEWLYSKENDETRKTRESARMWANRTMPPYVRESRLNFYQHMADGGKTPFVFHHQFMKDAAKGGYLGLVTPEDFEYHLSLSAIVAIIEELACVDAGLALKIIVQNSLTAFPILNFGNNEQIDALIGPMAEGKIIACFGLSEPEYGSDAMNIQCQAKEDPEGEKIKGKKIWITSANAPSNIEKVMVLIARTGDPNSGGDGITAFIAPLNVKDPNLRIETIKKMGQFTSQFCEVGFNDYLIPHNSILGSHSKGKEVLKKTLAYSRSWIAAQGTGIAMHAYQEAVKHTNKRYIRGMPLSQQTPMVRNLDHMKREIEIARLLVKKAAYSHDTGDPNYFVWSSLAKLVAGEVALVSAHNAQTYHGAMGYTVEMPIGQLATDAEVVRIYEGSPEVHKKVCTDNNITPDQQALVLPLLNHEKPIEEMPTVEDVMGEVESWKIYRKREND